MDRNTLEEKSKPELIALGESMGLQLTPATTKGDMIDRILGLPVAASKPEGDVPKEGHLRTLDGDLVGGDKVRVMIMATETEKSDVFLSLNGHALQIQRGVEVTIPAAYLGVLRDSVVNTVTKDPETGRVSPIQIMRHPFTAAPA